MSSACAAAARTAETQGWHSKTRFSTLSASPSKIGIPHIVQVAVKFDLARVLDWPKVEATLLTAAGTE